MFYQHVINQVLKLYQGKERKCYFAAIILIILLLSSTTVAIITALNLLQYIFTDFSHLDLGSLSHSPY